MVRFPVIISATRIPKQSVFGHPTFLFHLPSALRLNPPHTLTRPDPQLHPPAQAPADALEYVRYLNSNTAAFLGPHGGGLCNFKWLATGTLVLELMPREWINTPLYEEAIGHGLNYWVDLRVREKAE